jgi:hypothetical protein
MKLIKNSLLFVLVTSLSSLYAQPVTWDSSTSYSTGALVIVGGLTYVARTDVPANNTPPIPTYWSSLKETAKSLEMSTAVLEALPQIDVAALLNILPDPPPDGGSGNNTNLDPLSSGLTTSSDESFVRQQYVDFLGRSGDSAGINFWTNLVKNGTIYRADVIDNFVFSAEFQSVIAPVSRLYLAYYKRLPDTDGLKYWIEQKINGMTLNDMSQHFADAPEFKSTYGTLSDEEFVKLVYQNVLNRSADQSGLNYWKGLLVDKTLVRGSVMTGFSESEENKKLTINNIRVISFYYGMLRRAPDESGYNYWVLQFSNGIAANALLNAFYLGDEYQGRFN